MEDQALFNILYYHVSNYLDTCSYLSLRLTCSDFYTLPKKEIKKKDIIPYPSLYFNINFRDIDWWHEIVCKYMTPQCYEVLKERKILIIADSTMNNLAIQFTNQVMIDYFSKKENIKDMFTITFERMYKVNA